MTGQQNKEAEQLYNETFARWLYASSLISNFKSTFTDISSSANKHLEEKSTELIRSLFEDPQWEGLLVETEPGSAKPAPDYRALGKVAAKEIFETSYAHLDSAVLVFYHSLLDALAFDCCRVTAIQAPRDWEQDLKNTKVLLLDTQNQSFEQLLRAKLKEHLANLGRESLLTKTDRLFARCNPPPGWSPMEGYAFDLERIRQFDDQRHEIIHGKALGKPLTLFQVSEDSLFFVQRTGIFLIGLIHFKYGLQIDPGAMQRLSQQAK